MPWRRRVASVGWPSRIAGERGGRVELGVREEPDLLELFGREKMGFVDHENHSAVAFVFLGGEQGGGLVYGFGLVESGGGARGRWRWRRTGPGNRRKGWTGRRG